MTRSLVLTALGLLLITSLPIRADDQDVIDYRTHVMKTLGEQLDAVGLILENKIPPDNLGAHLKVMAVTATQAKKAFEPKVQGGNAKSEIWTNWADFSKRIDELVSGTADLAAAGQNVAAVSGKMRSALKCKSCHDTYRKPLK